ncbi:hypothetical protein [Nocardia wallacei]|uniref:hypothetical protein n=1 Tax=Nocardia wallacei TaxID=480035 RepID=UPI0024589A9E|nr:hypothetical protein [Nocardia wallacei]
MHTNHTTHHRQPPDLLKRARRALRDAKQTIDDLEYVIAYQEQIITDRDTEIARLKGEK